ncbi:hypothetical protein [uncultured Winogradskyella sp.]|uniref:hypothetical protein n=1 Tax=uncultured Winogradskyella sp. TaxID=395353 RepID=UPI0026065A20|nr:hypothetical protein [uncultured Winogradskyella sp.]
MVTNKFVVLLFICILFSCNTIEEDTSFKIYHLKPNNIHKNPERVTKNGWFTITRNDFFVVKNYDINNEQHKIKIDSFVVNYLKKDDFLTTNKNVNWRLTFFKYGDGIDEHTEHISGTDYTIHNLFSYKKEIANYYFNTKIGYAGTYYRILPEELNKDKRKIVSNYFNTLDLNLEQTEGFTKHLTAVSKRNDTIQVVARLISKEDWDVFYVGQLKVEKVLRGMVNSDTLKVSYKNNNSLEIGSEQLVLNLIEYDLVAGDGPKYYVVEDDSKIALGKKEN